MRFVTEDDPLSDEIEAIKKANESIEQFGAVEYSEIDWG